MKEETIQKNLHKMIRNVAEGESSAFDVVELLNEQGEIHGNKLLIERRKLQPEPTPLAELQRSDNPHHTLHTIESLSAYIEKYGGENTVLVADADALTATLILDETVEEGGQTIIFFRPALHPVFKLWCAFFEDARKVLDFAQFALENRRQIKTPDGKQLSFIFSQIQLSKETTVNTGRGPEQINGVMVKMKVGSGAAQEVQVDLPEMITVETPIFLTGDPEHVEFDLLVYGATRNGEDIVVVKGSNPDVTAQMANSFIDDIRSLEDSKALVTFGKADWKSPLTIS